MNLVMAGRAHAPHRRPLGELKSTNAHRASARETHQGPAAKQRGEVVTKTGERRPVSATPMLQPVISGTSRAFAGGGRCGAQSAKVFADPGAVSIVMEGTQKDGSMDDQRLSAELLRLLEERSIQSPQKVSPHKEVAERASEDCPRRPLPRSNPGKTGTARAASASRITPCAPSEPKAGSHARKTVKSAARTGISSRPRTAAPRIEQPAPAQRNSLGGRERRSEQAAALAKRDNLEPTGVVQPDCISSAEPPTRQPQLREVPHTTTVTAAAAEQVRSGSREGRRERSFNSLASARASKDGTTAGGDRDSGTAPAGSSARSKDESQKATGVKSKSTIADLIARFRNGPPQRPDERKPAAASSTSIFWWQKDKVSNQEHLEEGDKIISADGHDQKKDRSGWGHPLRSSSGDETGHAEERGASARSSVARSSTGRSSTGSASSSAPGPGASTLSLRDAWKESARRSQEAVSRSSISSTKSSRASVHGSEAEVLHSGNDSDFGQSGADDCSSARASIDSIDQRASVVLRQASSAMDSTVDRTADTGTNSCISSPPSILNAQVPPTSPRSFPCQR